MSDFQESLNALLADPAQMEKLVGLAKSIAGDGTQTDGTTDGGAVGGSSPLDGLDPRMLGMLGKMMSEYSAKSDKQALIAAITPFLKDSRRSKIEQAAQMAKLARLAKLAMMQFGEQ